MLSGPVEKSYPPEYEDERVLDSIDIIFYKPIKKETIKNIDEFENFFETEINNAERNDAE